jgi:hypothetical protein
VSSVTNAKLASKTVSTAVQAKAARDATGEEFFITESILLTFPWWPGNLVGKCNRI